MRWFRDPFIVEIGQSYLRQNVVMDGRRKVLEEQPLNYLRQQRSVRS
ncbi:MAG: hypothetical protein QNI99_11495 [Woeseiaceae bacterium]|nr:hypothetical protein [Woeseiaceae bacterium]